MPIPSNIKGVAFSEIFFPVPSSYLDFDLIGNWAAENSFTPGSYCDQATPCDIPCSNPPAPDGADNDVPFVTAHLGSAPIVNAKDGVAQEITITIFIDLEGCQTVNTTIGALSSTPNGVSYFEFDVDDPTQNEFTNTELKVRVDKLTQYLYVEPEFEVTISGGAVTAVTLVSGGQGIFAYDDSFQDITFSDGSNSYSITSGSGMWSIDTTFGSPTFGHVVAVDNTGPYTINGPPSTPIDGTYPAGTNAPLSVEVPFLIKFFTEDLFSETTLETLPYLVGDPTSNLDTAGLNVVDNGSSFTVTIAQGGVGWNANFTSFLAYQAELGSVDITFVQLPPSDYDQLIDQITASVYFESLVGDDSGTSPIPP